MLHLSDEWGSIELSKTLFRGTETLVMRSMPHGGGILISIPLGIAMWAFLLAGCFKKPAEKVGNCQHARDVKRVCEHQGRDCGTILCAGEKMRFQATK